MFKNLILGLEEEHHHHHHGGHHGEHGHGTEPKVGGKVFFDSVTPKFSFRVLISALIGAKFNPKRYIFVD